MVQTKVRSPGFQMERVGGGERREKEGQEELHSIKHTIVDLTRAQSQSGREGEQWCDRFRASECDK